MIYGVIVHKGGRGYTVLSTGKAKITKFATKEREKGFKVSVFHRAGIRIDSEEGFGGFAV
jgi:hypothetical protein